MLRGGDIVRIEDRCFKVQSRVVKVQTTPGAIPARVEVDSSIPDNGQDERNITEQTPSDAAQGASQMGDVVEDTPATDTRFTYLPMVRQPDSPTSRLGGISVDPDYHNEGHEIALSLNGAQSPIAKVEFESQDVSQDQYVGPSVASADSNTDERMRDDNEASPVSEMWKIQPSNESFRSNIVTTEIPNPVPLTEHTSVENSSVAENLNLDLVPLERPGESAMTRNNVSKATTSRHLNEAKVVPDSLRREEDSDETESEAESDTEMLVQPPSPAPNKKAQFKTSDVTVAVVVPMESTKRKAIVDEQDPQPTGVQNKRRKSGGKDSHTPIVTPNNQREFEETLSSRDSTTSSKSRSRSGKSASHTPSLSTNLHPYTGEAPVVIFSNSTVLEKPPQKKFVKEHCKVPGKAAEDFDILVVRKGELVKTFKLLQAIARGASIVTDDWISQSFKAGVLLALDKFVPKDPPREKEWGIKMVDLVGHDRHNLFAGKTLFVTCALKKEYGKGFRDIEQLARLVGVKKVISKPAKDFKDDENTIVLGLEEGDIDILSLAEKVPCYCKDLLSISIIRGKIDLEVNEFKLALTDHSSSPQEAAAQSRTQTQKKTTPSGSQTVKKGTLTGSQPVKKRGRPRKSV